MRIAIFGASGRTGRLLVEQALAAGHEVIAFVRDPDRLGIEHPALTVAQGDVLDAEAVAAAIAGVDAVLSALGHGATPQPGMLARAAEAIIAGMRQHGVRRLITLTGAGVRDPRDHPKALDNAIRFLLKLLAGEVFRDAQEHVALVRASDLDWTVVRAPMLTDDPATGRVRAGWVGDGTGPRVPRADVAAFMLAQLTDSQYLRQMPVVGI